MSLGAAGFERKTKRTRKREFLDEMNLVVPWAELVALIAPHAPPRVRIVVASIDSENRGR
jgi:IS5 family transposase